MLTDNEKDICRKALRMALEAGAQKARVTLAQSSMDLVATLDGEVDKVTACMDRSMEIALFADGRFGTFSTNRLEPSALKAFIARAVDTVRMLAPDPARDLPSPSRQVKGALSGLELESYDPQYEEVTAPERRACALLASAWPCSGKGWKLISEEGEYSDSTEYTFVVDSGGLEALHCETCFSYGVEVTIQDSRGRKYSGYWWDSTPFMRELDLPDIGRKALGLAVAQIGSKSARGGKYNMVVDSEVASKVFSPVLAALNGYNIQQNNSFLTGSLGKQVFPAGLTVLDRPHIKGQNGSRLFDSEGVATGEHAIIEDGVVKEYFLNTYMAAKLGMSPTQEEAIRPMVLPYLSPSCHPEHASFHPEPLSCHPEPAEGSSPLDRSAILSLCGSGILVTDFNGGNSNSATGDFSYGVEGYLFEDGKIVRPVSGMVVTGNFLTLWAHLLAAGSDARKCRQKLIPTLAFSAVDFSG